jgi:hypothetical protein
VARTGGALGSALVGPTGVAKWAQGPLPCPLASFVHFLHYFAQLLL